MEEEKKLWGWLVLAGPDYVELQGGPGVGEDPFQEFEFVAPMSVLEARILRDRLTTAIIHAEIMDEQRRKPLSTEEEPPPTTARSGALPPKTPG